jgi:hypothetical protein
MSRYLAVSTAIVMYAIAAISQTTDSPLVAAARRGADARRRAALAGTVVYTNDMIARSKGALSTTSSQAAVGNAMSAAQSMNYGYGYGSVAPPPVSAPPPATDVYAAQAAADPTLPRVSNNSGTTNTMPQEAGPTSAGPMQSGSPYRPPQ